MHAKKLKDLDSYRKLTRMPGTYILISSRQLLPIFWVERMQDMGILTSEQLQLGARMKERVVASSVPELTEQVSFESGSGDLH